MKASALALILLPALAGAAPAVDKAKAMGSPTAPVTIEIFSDFRCPMCKSFHETELPRLVKEYALTGKAYIVPREFPLDRTAGHQFARMAANYATAAARVGQYGPVADALFQNQEKWGDSGKVWETVASVLSPENQKKVQALVREPSVLNEVQADSEYGTAVVGVTGTPTVYLTRGAKRYPVSGYGLNYSLLKSMIDDLAK